MLQLRLTAFQPTQQRSYDLEFYDSWSELTLIQGIALAKIVERIPKPLHDYYAQVLQEANPVDAYLEMSASLTEEDKAKGIPMLQADILTLLVAPQSKEAFTHNLLPYMSPRYVDKLFEKVGLHFTLGLLFFPPSEKFEHITTAGAFTLEGQTYHLPRSRDIPLGDQTIKEYMADVTAVEFCETADLDLAARQLNGGKLEYAANIVAILCRPEGESYDERRSLARVPLFRQKLTMDIVWAVFFYTVQQYTLLLGYTHIYSAAAQAMPKAEMPGTLTATAGTAG